MSLTFDDIIKIFEEIELSLISSLQRNLTRHRAWEKAEGFEWSAWQAEKLKNIERFRCENLSIMNSYSNVIDTNTRLLMEEQFREGEELAQRQFEDLMNIPKDDTTSEVPVSDENLFGVNEDKMSKLMNDIVTIEKKAETAALRMMDDVYRKTLYKVQLAMGTGSMTLNQAIDLAVKDFLDKGINCIVYKDGRRVNISDYVRMALRTTSTRAKLQGQAKQLAQLGYDTVIISQYGKCSDTCLPWQGRVYIDDGFTPWQGETNGDMGKSNYCGKWFPLLSSAVKGGLFHPNCRHTMLQYIDGITKPPRVLDEEKIKETYRKEQQLRALERNVRKAKRKVQGSSDKENIKKAKEELKKAQSALREFLKENGQFRRDYGREKVYAGETDESNPNMIKAEENIKISKKDIQNDYSVNRKLVNSKEYHDKFKDLTPHKNVNAQIYQRSKAILENRDGTDTERMAVINSRTGELLATNIESGSDVQLKTGLTKEQYDTINSKNCDFIIIHNHPGSTRPSGTDILTLWKEQRATSSIVIGHDGTVYSVSNINRKIPLDKIYEGAYNNYKSLGYDDNFAKKKATDDLYELNAFDFERR